MAKKPGKPRKYLGFPGYFWVLPALDTRDRRGSLPGLPYCCSVGLTLATVVGKKTVPVTKKGATAPATLGTRA